MYSLWAICIHKHTLVSSGLEVTTHRKQTVKPRPSHEIHRSVHRQYPVEQVIINQTVFILERPQTPAEYERCLMFRRSLKPRHGMIFYYLEVRDTPKMYMKNTPMSLDMLFVDNNNRIACLFAHTKPLSLKLLSCNVPVKAVIELADGEAKHYAIRQGMSVAGLMH